MQASVASVKQRLGGNAVAIQWPIGAESDFKGLIDLVTREAYTYNGEAQEEEFATSIPEELKDTVEIKRQELLEAVVAFDDELMMTVLEGGEVEIPAFKEAIRKATLTSEFFPVVCGTSFKNKGVKKMIDAVVDYLPSPLDIPAIKAHKGEEEVSVEATDEGDFLCFSI